MQTPEETCRNTLKALEIALKAEDWETISAEFKSEQLNIFKKVSDDLINVLCAIAHRFVAQDQTVWQAEDIHPVYGVIINILFADNQRPLDLQIQFYFNAGETYANKYQLLTAQPYYTRAYYLYRQNNGHSFILETQLHERLQQLEAWLQADSFLKALTLVKQNGLETCIKQGLKIADQLLAVKLENKYLLLFYQVFSVYLSNYLDQLNNKLQLSVNEDPELKMLTQLIRTKLFPLAECLQLHSNYEKTLSKWVSACYNLFDNVLRNCTLINYENLQLEVQTHRNQLRSHYAIPVVINPQPMQWLQIWLLLEEAQQTLTQDPLDTSHYSQAIKKTVAILCGYLNYLLGQPPCPFTIIASGSLAQNEAMLNSDLDLALLLEIDLTAENELIALRQHPYFQLFISELNRWLSLCHGGFWLIKKTSAERENTAAHDRHYDHFTCVYTGLRIEAMDLLELQKSPPTIVNTPQGLANFVASYCTEPDELTRDQEKILAHSLLFITPLYSSHANANNSGDEYHKALLTFLMANTNRPLKLLYWENIPQSVFVNYWFYRWQQYHYSEGSQHRLLQLWARRQQLSLDKAILFIKDCLRLLTDWAQGVVNFFGEENLLTHAELLEALLKLANNKHLAVYFIHTWQQTRQLLLQIKYSLETSAVFNNAWPQTITRHFEWVIAPLLQQFQMLDTLIPQRLQDPLAYAWQKQLTQHNTLNSELLITWLNYAGAKAEDFRRYYDLLAKDNFNRPLLEKYLDRLIAQGHQAALIDAVIQITNAIGFRQSERLAYKKLQEHLFNLNKSKNKHPKITATLTWYDETGQLQENNLDAEIIDQIIETADSDIKKYGNIRKIYHDSLHEVAPITADGCQLHIKQLSTQPLMDYAIDILARRLFGFGTPANKLARLSVSSATYQNSYPVFISMTVGKRNLKTALAENADLQVDAANYTALIILSLLTLTGDGASRNYMLTEENTLVCVDNEQQFVEPVIKEVSLRGLYKVQFCNILFCLAQANKSLDYQALKSFSELNNTYNIVSGWVEQVAQQGNYYQTLFNEDERKAFYASDKKFTPLLLLREGVLGTLLINLNYLQNYLQIILQESKPLPTALDLLELINPRLGHYYRNAFSSKNHPEKRLQAATDAPKTSVTSSLAIKASLGIVPDFAEIEKGKTYNLSGAKKEIIALLNFIPDFSKLINPQGQPDVNRQLMVLKAMSLWPHQVLNLSHCAALTDELLEIVLAKSTQLRILKLNHCPRLTNQALIALAENHPNLQELYFTDHPTIASIDHDGLFIKNALYFPNLKILHLSRCKSLKNLRINAPNLVSLKGYEDGNIHVILYGKEYVSPYYKYPSTLPTYKGHAVPVHAYNSDEEIKADAFGTINIVLIVFKNDSSTVSKIAKHIRETAPKPLPILLLSINPYYTYSENVGHAGYFKPLSDAKDDITSNLKEVIQNSPKAAILFHNAIIHALKIGKLNNPMDFVQLEAPVFLGHPGIPTFQTVSIGTTRGKADHNYRFFTSKYGLLGGIISDEFFSKICRVNNQLIKIQFWDTANNGSFLPEGCRHYENSQAILVFAPIENRDDFLSCVKQCINEINAHAPKNIITILIGINLEQRENNKSAITQDEAITIAREYNMTGYFECSARTGAGINEAYLGAFELTLEKTGFWKWLGESSRSANYRANLLLPPDQYLRPVSFSPETNLAISADSSANRRKHQPKPAKTYKEDNNIHVIIYGEEYVAPYYAYPSTLPAQEKHAIYIHAYNSNEKIKADSFGSINIAIIVFNNVSSSIDEIANEIRKAAQRPLPIVLVSIDPAAEYPQCADHIGYFKPSNDDPKKYKHLLLQEVIEHSPTTAMLFHKAIINSLKIKELDDTPEFMHLRGLYYHANSPSQPSILPEFRMLAIEPEIDGEANHGYQLYTGNYCLQKTTIGFDSLNTYKVNNQFCKIQIRDVYVHKHNVLHASDWHRTTIEAMLIYASIENHDVFLNRAKLNGKFVNDYEGSSIPVILIAINLEQRENNTSAISQDEAIAIAKEYNMAAYFECSAATGAGVEEAHLGAFELALEKLGFWKWLGEPARSANYYANLLLPPDQYLRPKSFPSEKKLSIYANPPISSHWHQSAKPDEEDDSAKNNSLTNKN